MCIGSGSTYIYGYCDAEFKEGMTRAECEKFVTNGEFFFPLSAAPSPLSVFIVD